MVFILNIQKIIIYNVTSFAWKSHVWDHLKEKLEENTGRWLIDEIQSIYFVLTQKQPQRVVLENCFLKIISNNTKLLKIYTKFLKNIYGGIASENSFSSTFCKWFFNKNVPHVMFYYLTKFHCLVAFTSWDIGQHLYCNYLLTRLWRHGFWS